MIETTFQVQGSAPEPYDVRFVNRGNGNMSAYCTCPAGQNGKHCKHRIRILQGTTADIVSGNEADVAVVTSWLPGTDVESALSAFVEAESRCESAKKDLARAKKALVGAFLD